jgi:hypothetical protein
MTGSAGVLRTSMLSTGHRAESLAIVQVLGAQQFSSS